MELKDYSTEELREELKRRNLEERKLRAVNNKPVYMEVEGIVTDIFTYGLSFTRNEFKVKINDPRINDYHKHTNYGLKMGCFKKNEIPRIGDTVLIRQRITKARKSFSTFYAKIVKVVKRKEE